MMNKKFHVYYHEVPEIGAFVEIIDPIVASNFPQFIGRIGVVVGHSKNYHAQIKIVEPIGQPNTFCLHYAELKPAKPKVAVKKQLLALDQVTDPKEIRAIWLRKFVDILNRLNRSCQDRYNGKCEQQIFVHRVLHQFFAGKYFRFVDVGTTLDVYEKSDSWTNHPDREIELTHYTYARCNRIEFVLGYGTEIAIHYTDASKPTQLFNKLKLNHGGMLKLLFEEIPHAQYNMVLELFDIPNNVPEHKKLKENERAVASIEMGSWMEING